MSTVFSPEVIAEAKRRYADLKAKGQEADDFPGRVAASAAGPETLRAEAVSFADSIPGGWYWHGVIRRGETLRITNTSGNEGVSALFWNRSDTSERLNPADTIKVQWSARIAKGRVLLTDMGRAMLSVTDDTGGYSDCVAGGSTPFSNVRKYGDATLFNARDHFIRAAAKHGLGKRDVGPCISFFAPVVTDAAGRLLWNTDTMLAGARVDLRAEMDLIGVVANCPHPLGPASVFAPGPIDIAIWRSDPSAEDDLCRTGTEEAVRAFENTDALTPSPSTEEGGRYR